MQGSGGTSSNSAAQRPVVPGNPVGSMHDYGSGVRAAVAASNGYGTMDQNFNNNNPYIGNNGSVVENMKGFECSDLDNSLLTGPRANTANPSGSIAMQNTASFGMHSQQNIPVSSAGNMQQQYNTNSSYGMMQTSAAPNAGQNFDYNTSQTQMPVGPQTQMFSNSSDYTKQQQINAAVASSGNTRGMNETFNTDPMTNTRRLSTPVMSTNQSQSYLQRSNSYPANSNFGDGNFPSSGRNYQEQNFNPNLPNSQMRNRSYSSSYAQDGFSASNGGSWSDSGYNMQSKNALGGMSSPQFAGGMRGMRYPNQRGAYSGTNSEMTGNNYGNNSMQSIQSPNFHGGNKMMSMNYPDRNSAMGHQNTMGYSQSMNQLQHGGSSQKLRHYGPMPNSGVGQRMPFPSSTQRTRAMPTQYPGSQYGNQASMDSYTGGYQSNMSRYPVHNQMTARRTMTSSMPGQPGAGMVELGNIAASDNFYNRTSKPDGFNHQEPGSTHEMYGSHFPNSQNQFDSLSGAMPGTYQQPTDNPISATQARKNMIFSAELEKLARLSRNPMLEADFNLPVHEASSVNVNPAPMVPAANQQMSSYNQGTHQNQTMSQNTMPPCSVMQQQQHQQPSGRNVPPHVPNVYNTKMPGTPVTPQPPVPPNSKQTPMEQGYNSPANSAPPTPVVSQNQSIQRATPERTTASSAPATPVTSQDTTRQTNSADAVINSSAASPAVIDKKPIDVKKEAGSQQIDKLTQSVKDKQDEITKANPNHHEYLSDNNVPAGQNCIAALSAACRNMIADMDSSMPKQSRQAVQSPLGNKSGDGMTLTPMRAPSVPGSVVSGGQLTPSSDVSMSSVGMSGQASTPLAMHMDNFSSPPSNYGNMMGSDFQTQYHDFLEQSVPMHPNSKQLAEKVRKPRKRRKSEDVMDTGVNQTGVKKRKPRKKSQNPSSVESLETVQSLDNISECTTLSDSHGQFVDDNCRSASQTPTSVPTSWCNPRVSSADMSCIGSGPGQMPQSHIMDTDQSTQDFLDSVFSPDTTMSNMIMQDVADSVMMGHVNPNHQSPTSSYASHHSNNDNASVASYQSQSSLPTPTSQNPSLTNLDQSHVNLSNGPKTISGQPNNNMVSSSGDLVSGSVTTSGDRIDTASDKPNSAEEAHPLEILQAQIQLQRQQFNLSDSRPLPLREPSVKKPAGTNSVRKTGTNLSGEVDVDVLMAEEDSTWYVPSEQPKEPEVPWEQTRKTAATCKGRNNSTSLWHPSDMKVYLL